MYICTVNACKRTLMKSRQLDNTARNHTVAMRVTLQEKFSIIEKADSLGIKVADYIALKVFQAKGLSGVNKDHEEEISNLKEMIGEDRKTIVDLKEKLSVSDGKLKKAETENKRLNKIIKALNV